MDFSFFGHDMDKTLGCFNESSKFLLHCHRLPRSRVRHNFSVNCQIAIRLYSFRFGAQSGIQVEPAQTYHGHIKSQGSVGDILLLCCGTYWRTAINYCIRNGTNTRRHF